MIVLHLPCRAEVTIFDADFNNAVSGQVTAVANLGTPVQGSWELSPAPAGGISTETSGNRVAAFSHNTTAIANMSPIALNKVTYAGNYPETQTADAAGGTRVRARFSAAGTFTGGETTTVAFDWGSFGTSNTGAFKYSFVRGLDNLGREVFELLFVHGSSTTIREIYVRGANDRQTTLSTASAGAPQGTKVLTNMNASVSQSTTVNTPPADLLRVSAFLSGGNVTFTLSNGGLAAPVTTAAFPVNSAATSIMTLEFTQLWNASVDTQNKGFWLDNVSASTSAAVVPQEQFLQHDYATTDSGEFGASYLLAYARGQFALPTDVVTAGLSSSGVTYATAGGDTSAVLTLEFVSPVDLTEFFLWGFRNGTNSTAATKDFTLTFFDGPLATGNQVGPVFASTATQPPSSGDFAAQSFALGSTRANVRSVVMNIQSNYGNTFVGLSEIGFAGTRASSTVKRIKVYLLGGQSNADGYGLTADLNAADAAPNPDVFFYHGNGGGESPLPARTWLYLQPGSGSKPGNAGGFGPELAFGDAMDAAVGSDAARVAIIKHAVGGSNLHTQWLPGGDATLNGDGPFYQDFQTTVAAGMASLRQRYPAAEITIEGMLWHQGESDTGTVEVANVYQTNLTNLIADVRATYGADVRFLIGRLSPIQYSTLPVGFWTVRQAQETVAAASPVNGLVSSDGLPVWDPGNIIHFNTSGQIGLGSRYAAAMQTLPIADSGGNGMDDAWEETYWGSGNSGQDSNGNPDGDEFSNLQEFLLGTSPLVHNTFQASLVAGPGQLTLAWPSTAQRRYLIEQSSDLNTWRRIDSFIPGSSGTSTSYELPAGTSSSRRFFRVSPQR